MKEFTGERVVPGQVDIDLWNEHVARYTFAARLSRGKRVLDLACGMGYGTAILADDAHSVTALDVSAEAVTYARENYQLPSVRFVCASGATLPFRDASFDLVAAFEVIEHLNHWQLLLEEARRVLAPGGQLIISTPNKLYYAESRKLTGPNPFHHHEFQFEEFRNALGQFFAHVSLFLQNHAAGIVFQPVTPDASAEIRLQSVSPAAETAHFYVAVCAQIPQLGAPTFVYLPSAGNVLREREQHIAFLEGELALKDKWLEEIKQQHRETVELFRKQKDDLEQANAWAHDLNSQMEEARQVVARIEDEHKQAATAMAASYEAKVSDLERENDSKTQWAQNLSADIQEKSKELAHCLDVLHETEKILEERTAWAQKLQAQCEELQFEVAKVEASRWIKLGRALGLGPGARKS